MPQIHAQMPEEIEKKETKTSRFLKLFIKFVITVACIWYVSGKIDFDKADKALGEANWWYLLLALILFVLSKVISAIRLNIYFKNINIRLTEWQNTKLYWLGMFYNLFLPGSISGDAYKVVLLTKKYGVPYKKTAAAVLLDRFSGLLGLAILLCIYGFMVLKYPLAQTSLLIGTITAIAALYLAIKFWFKDFISSFLSTLLLGVAVQAAQVICIYFIMAALGIPYHITEYIFIFLVSSVVAVLPLTIGGLGAREIVFLEGSKYFGLIQENSVIISLLFYLVTLLVSALGLVCMYRNPLKEKRAQD